MRSALLREVRLGLVCYGGVSLAIYMHGVTKELYKLVRAARAFENAWDGLGGQVPADEDPDRWLAGPGLDTERTYFAALAALSARGTPLTVTLDIIAGTSAGGINGVCLARGLAEGRSLDGFRNLWLADADMEELLAGHALLPWGQPKLLSKLAESAARLLWHRDAGLLDGDLMSRLLYRALDGMAATGDSLIRADESLDLFVTTTSVYGYETVIPTGDGGVAHTDKSYRQLLRFHYDQRPPAPAVARFSVAPSAHPSASPAADPGADFSAVPALAFAARATASFPGAFPPVSLDSFLHAVAGPGLRPPADAAGQIARHFVYGPEYGATGASQWFMDGGVLDNGPFDHVIDAIAAKRADGATARELIYIEPDPGLPSPPGQQAPDPEPTFARTVWASRVTIPQHTPLVGVLGQLAVMNATIGEVGAIVDAQTPAVLEQLDPGQVRGAVGYADVTVAAEQVRLTARRLTGLGYATYARLRAQAVAEAFASSLSAELGFPAESNQAGFLTAVFSAWARQQQAWRNADPDALEAQLGEIDIPFRLRRADFVLQGINRLFSGAEPGQRAELAAMKSTTWDLLTRLRAQQQQVAIDVRGQALALFGPQALTQDDYLADPELFAGTGPGGHGPELAGLYQACLEAVGRHRVAGSSEELWTSLTAHTRTWDQPDQAGLLSRYIGFPIWDALIFPVVSLARLPQLTPIGVQRFSPLDATCLAAVDHDGNAKDDPCAKLDGTALRHFGAFFEKAWRENDYLWGRLDGAEQIMRLLTRQAAAAGLADPGPADPGLAGPADLTGPLRAALTAILTAEQPSLTAIGPVCAALATQIENITTIGPNEVA